MNTLPSLIPQDGPLERIGAALASELRKIIPDAGISCFSGGGSVQIIGHYNFESISKYGYCSMSVAIDGDFAIFIIEYKDIPNYLMSKLEKEDFGIRYKDRYYDLREPNSIEKIIIDFTSLAELLYKI